MSARIIDRIVQHLGYRITRLFLRYQDQYVKRMATGALYGHNRALGEVFALCMGINQYSLQTNGEKLLQEGVLRLSSPNPVIFDVGGRVGAWSMPLIETGKVLDVQAKCFVFEPNPIAFKLLQDNLPQEHVQLFQYGVGCTDGEVTLYDEWDNPGSSKTSQYKEAITTLEQTAAMPIVINQIKLDSFCEKQGIDRVDFLKIDVEGNELDVLRGASTLLEEKKIKVIQFEFNAMNVLSRSFLKDFYKVLEGYSIFRLLPDGLVALGPWHPGNEVFRYQNLVAIEEKEISGDTRGHNGWNSLIKY